MEDTNVVEYFIVTVKIRVEKGFSKAKNEPIYKNETEKILVHCGDPKTAARVVEKEMEGFSEEWRIASVTETKISKIIEGC